MIFWILFELCVQTTLLLEEVDSSGEKPQYHFMLIFLVSYICVYKDRQTIYMYIYRKTDS